MQRNAQISVDEPTEVQNCAMKFVNCSSLASSLAVNCLLVVELSMAIPSGEA